MKKTTSNKLSLYQSLQMFTWKKSLKACNSQEVLKEAVKEKLLCFLSHTLIWNFICMILDVIILST